MANNILKLTSPALTISTAAYYEVIHYRGISGREEYIRLALEETGASYKDTAFPAFEK